MNLEALQIPAFITIILTLTSLIVMPIVVMAESKDPLPVSDKSSDVPEGSACDLPPTVDIEGKNAVPPGSELPSIDNRATDNFRTATFAMG